MNNQNELEKLIAKRYDNTGAIVVTKEGKKVQRIVNEFQDIDDGEYIYINKDYMYVSNNILINFVGDSDE